SATRSACGIRRRGCAFFVLFTFGWRALLPVLFTESALSLWLWATDSTSPLPPLSLLHHLVGALIPVVGYLLAALALRAWNTGCVNTSFAHQQYTGRFLVAALLGCAVTAGLGTVRLLHSGAIPVGQFSEIWFYWLVGDFIGVMTLTPLLLVHLSPRLRDWLQWAAGGSRSRTPNCSRGGDSPCAWPDFY
ncbi:MAG: hypothetical protein HC889_19495, partial [Synechococcaceae cyanobacterium SM1_2_3]|nr:hypothetical protein [Synechococcaceae cyanobacterium SM1_2_3]